MIESDLEERTADRLLEYHASDGDPGWVSLWMFGGCELLYNPADDRCLVARLVRNLESRGLAEPRRVSSVMQFRMTDDGRELIAKWQQANAELDAMIDWSDLLEYFNYVDQQQGTAKRGGPTVPLNPADVR
ncbi:hypothetical protein [Crateriforma conspicua]|uniref:HTH marR-type domain-containing protein n=1 Tax=Crateriforma conspicua TaxID=2527996 RepID=A0A5C5Y588_9PLAN|nr:hypothetical protein [Crateriforma conspicua]TWT69445.1 hypothetical protein Pan14r_17310 [Crateriforma conspicua]